MNIVLNEYDSGFLAEKAGNIFLQNTREFNRELEKKLLSKIHHNNYNFISLKSPGPINPLYFKFQGKLFNLAIDPKKLFDVLNPVQNKINVIGICDSHWASVKELFNFASETRFSSDPNISKSLAQKHKMAMVMTYHKANPALTNIILDKNNKVIGFFCSYINDTALNLYELLVHPNYIRGYLAACLLKAVLRVALKINSKLSLVETNVYENNNPSLNFFKGLGFNEGKVYYYYHYWNNPSREGSQG